MKIRSICVVMVIASAIAASPQIYRHALARAQLTQESHTVHLPFMTAPYLPPQVELTPFASGFDSDTITAITHAGDDRLFVAVRSGLVYVVESDGTVLSSPFLDIYDRVKLDYWELGLLGIAFHPKFPAVPYFFVTYTAEGDSYSNNKIRVSRFELSEDDPNEAVENSEAILVEISKTGKISYGDYRSHNAGQLHFGPDGYLYIAVGDGGPEPSHESTLGDPDNRGQRKDELMGNILRINVNEEIGALQPDCSNGPYTIPPDNPFADGPGGACDEIWSTGLRNPYRFSFDSQTGELYISDVGENRSEEINYQPADSPGGHNYGWVCYEGTAAYRANDHNICPQDSAFTWPIFAYGHIQSQCSVIGGFVYRGQQFPSLFGRYLFGDFCSGSLWLLNRTGEHSWERTTAADSHLKISTFGEDANGELYVGNRDTRDGPAVFHVTAVP